MGQEFFDGVVLPRELGFAQHAVDFAVADGVQHRDGAVFTALQFGSEVMATFLATGNFPSAERTDPRAYGAGDMGRAV